MLFDQPAIATRYIDKNELREYLILTLKIRVGFDYEVFIRTHMGNNQLRINIDETTMTLDSYKAIQDFMRAHQLQCDLDILTQFIKDAASNQPNGHRIEVSYLVPDLEGVYIIRDQMQEQIEDPSIQHHNVDGPGMGGATGG